MPLSFLKRIALTATVTLGLAGAAQASTIGFGNQPGNFTPYSEGNYVFGPVASIDNSGGNCPFGDPACLKLSSTGQGALTSVELTHKDSLAFDLLDFAFEFTGNAAQGPLSITAGGSTLQLFLGQTALDNVTVLDNQVSYLASQFLSAPIFQDVTKVTFNMASGGSLRIDNLGADDGQSGVIPLPASGILLLAGLGGMAALRRKRS